MLEVQDYRAGYGKVPVLRNVTFQVDEGEMVAIIGPERGRQEHPAQDDLRRWSMPNPARSASAGRASPGCPPTRSCAAGSAYVPEGGASFPNMTVMDNLRMGAYSRPRILKTGVLDEMYQLFPVLEERSSQYARTLSGGERQMLAIARGLVSRPEADHARRALPGLAPKLVDEIYEKIRGLKQIRADRAARRAEHRLCPRAGRTRATSSRTGAWPWRALPPNCPATTAHQAVLPGSLSKSFQEFWNVHRICTISSNPFPLYRPGKPR